MLSNAPNCYPRYRRLHSFLNKGRRAGIVNPSTDPLAADAVSPASDTGPAGVGVAADGAVRDSADDAITISHCTLSWFGDESLSKGVGAYVNVNVNKLRFGFSNTSQESRRYTKPSQQKELTTNPCAARAPKGHLAPTLSHSLKKTKRARTQSTYVAAMYAMST